MYKWNRVIRSGSNEVRLEGESQSLRAFWEEMAFWDSLPQAGPNGEADLQFSYRSPKGNDYYSILCEAAKMEFKFGILKANPQQLFPKTWERALHGHFAEDDDEPPPAEREHNQHAQTAAAPSKSNSATKSAATTSASTTLKLAPQSPAGDNSKAMGFAEGLAVQIRQHYALLGWCGPNRDDYATKPIRDFENEFVPLTEWYKDALFGFPLADLQAMLAKLKTMVPEKPEAAKAWNSSTFWMAARGLKTTEGFPLVDDEMIRVVLRKYPDGKGYIWAAAWAELEDLQREDATRARRVA